MSTQPGLHKRAAGGFVRLHRITFTLLIVLLGLTAHGFAAPVINSLSPTAGAVGTAVTITGNNFGSSQSSSTVTFNGTVAASRGRLAVSWSNTSIVVNVPSGATSGNVVVTVSGSASNGVNFAVIPAITSLSPTSGPVNTSVTIAGTNFGATQGASTVTFNGATATPSSWSNASIAAPVPAGASTGNVVVTVSSNASNGVSFKVTPSITSLSPASGAAGTSISIAGTAFGSTQGSSTVTFNGTAATPTSWSNTSISAPVPNGATTGNVVVTVGGIASNGTSFTVALGIGSDSPTFGPVGTTVTINGTGFGTAGGTVTFNGTTTSPTTWSSGSVVAPVPTGATSGNVVVTVAGTTSNGKNFTVTPSPTNPAATFTFNVNTTADTVDATPGDSLCADSVGNCSLRAAVMESNASLASGITKSVTISVPAGTYQLVIPDNGLFNSTGGHLDATAGPVSILGASASNTIVEAGSQLNANGIPNGIDKVFAINPFGAFAGFAATLSNLTIQFGLNQSTSDPFGGGIEWDAGTDGAGTISITNCTIASNATVITSNTATTTADGGGISLTNEVPSPVNEGSITIASSVIQGNIAQDTGGGIFEGSFPMQISNSQILNNQAVDNPAAQGIGQSGGAQTGGGLSVSGPTVGNQTLIQGNTISGNIAGAQGGGIFTTAGVQVTSDTLTTNHAGATGGGLFSNTNSETTQVAGTNITLNVAGGDGGGVEVDNSPTGNNLTMSFSRLVGNTAAAGSGLNNISGTVTATDNWWGCNQGPGTSPCDVVNNTATATFNPWLTLSNTANPASIAATSSTTLTASLLQDSAGTTFTAGSQNLNALAGLPVSFQNAIGGSLSNCQTTIQSNGTATCTFTGSATGSADAVVDKATVTAHVNVTDFSVSLAPASQPVVRGGSVNYTLTVAPVNGFTGTVNLICSVSGGTGITLSGCPSSVTITSGSVNATITATASLTASLTNDQVNAQGTNASVSTETHNASGTLAVTDFSVSVTPASVAVIEGISGSFTATISPQNGFTGQVNISCSILPAGPTITGCPASVNITTGAATFNITAGTSGVTPQTYTLTVQGTSNVVPADTHSAAATLNVQNFSVSSPAQQSVVRGGSVNYTFSVAPVNGFTGTINLTCSVSGGTGITLSGCPSSVTITSGSVNVTITAAASLTASLTNDQVTVQGTSASVPADTSSGSSTLVVTDFSVSVTPASVAVIEGISGSFTATISPQNGFTGQVNISCSILPAGPTITGCPASVNITTGAATFNITAGTSGVTPQTYTLTVQGTSNVVPADTHSAAATLNVQNFSVSPPAQQSVVRGGSANYTFSIVPVNGFTGSINLTCSVSGGTGITLSGCPSSVTITSGSVNVTITAAASLSASLTNDQVTVQGTSASVPADTSSGSSTLVVTDFTVSVAPASQNALLGGSVGYTVTASSLNGFSGTVALSCGGAPPGGSISCIPSSINVPSGGSGTSTLTVTTSGATVAGTFTLSVVGTFGSVNHATSATLTMTDTRALSIVGSLFLPDGSLGSGTFSVTVNGFTVSVPVQEAVINGRDVDSSSTLAAALAHDINAAAGSPVTASASTDSGGNFILTLTAKTAGAPLTISSQWAGGGGGLGLFIAVPVLAINGTGSLNIEGSLIQFDGSLDSGTFSVTVNGFTVSVPVQEAVINGRDVDSSSTLAAALAHDINAAAGSPVTASASTDAGGNFILTLTAKTAGAPLTISSLWAGGAGGVGSFIGIPVEPVSGTGSLNIEGSLIQADGSLGSGTFSVTVNGFTVSVPVQEAVINGRDVDSSSTLAAALAHDINAAAGSPVTASASTDSGGNFILTLTAKTAGAPLTISSQWSGGGGGLGLFIEVPLQP